MFYAHSVKGAPVADWEPAPDHFDIVASLAGDRAAKFGCRPLGEAGGLGHDVGKLDSRFQPRLYGPAPSFDHAAAGAAYMSTAVTPPRLGKLVAYGIAGHHAGLANGAPSAAKTRRRPLSDRVASAMGDLPAVLRNADACSVALPTALPAPEGFKMPPKGFAGFSMSFLGRMLFSCLVDADYVGTEGFYAKAEGRVVTRGAYPPVVALRDRLAAHLVELEANASDTRVNRMRSDILKACVSTALEGERRGYKLTVPTGGGKTMASSAFALNHAVAADLDRVIVVVPFTSVIEQTATDLRRALGPDMAHAVVEHHSATDDADDMPEGREKTRLAVENWDAPIIVTTSVQFFESLFSSRPSKCRKLHNIARSVIVFDEAQTMPLHLLRPILAALSELVLNYRSTVVLATATQPALASRPAEGFDGMPDLVELCPDVDGVFQALGRVAVRHAGYLSDPDLERTILASPRILVIVNTKRHARELFERVRDLPHAYHLSTSMCGAHRSAVIAEIKARLRAGLPCVVVSTPLIEAGVNVDFPVVMRAEAGIDSVAQASGRCNREGLLDGMGEVVLFSVGKRHTLKCTASEVDVARGIVDRMAAGTLCGTLLDPSTVTEYFCDLYWTRGPDGLDEGGILALIEAGLSDLNFPYETIDDLFRMIDEEGTPVVVMEPTAADALSILGAEPSALDVSRAVRRHSVNVRSKDLGAMIDGGHIRFISEERFGRQFPTLASSELYDARIGFNIV